MQNHTESNYIVVLKLDEKYSSFGTLALTKDSEFLPLFNFYILTAYESGINKKIFRDYHYSLYTNKPYEMAEPQPLTYKNVMFPFIALGFMICISCLTTVFEIMTKKWLGGK